MNLMKKIALSAAVLMVFAATAGAAAATSNYAGEVMSIGVGARALGMGGAFVAVADDASTSYWNPAGMTGIQGVEVSSIKLTKSTDEHQNELDSNYSYVNLVCNGKEIGAFGIGWLRQEMRDIQLTTVDGSGNPVLLGVGKTNDNAIYLAYAYPVVKGFSLGLSGKFLVGNYPNPTGSNPDNTIGYGGFGLDLGALLNVNAFVKDFNLSIGVNVQDVYTQLTWDALTTTGTASTETVGLNIKPGVAYKLPIDKFEVVVACDVDTRYEQLLTHFGGELWWNKMLAIRGGGKIWGKIGGQLFTQSNDLSFGASLRWYFIGVDYTFVYTELAPVQYLSIIGKF